MFNGNSPSLADIAAVTGNNKDGWGDGLVLNAIAHLEQTRDMMFNIIRILRKIT